MSHLPFTCHLMDFGRSAPVNRLIYVKNPSCIEAVDVGTDHPEFDARSNDMYMFVKKIVSVLACDTMYEARQMEHHRVSTKDYASLGDSTQFLHAMVPENTFNNLSTVWQTLLIELMTVLHKCFTRKDGSVDLDSELSHIITMSSIELTKLQDATVERELSIEIDAAWGMLYEEEEDSYMSKFCEASDDESGDAFSDDESGDAFSDDEGDSKRDGKHEECDLTPDIVFNEMTIIKHGLSELEMLNNSLILDVNTTSSSASLSNILVPLQLCQLDGCIELPRGVTLETLLEEFRDLPLEFKFDIAIQTLIGMHQLWTSVGIAHGDLHIGNILLCPQSMDDAVATYECSTTMNGPSHKCDTLNDDLVITHRRDLSIDNCAALDGKYAIENSTQYCVLPEAFFPALLQHRRESGSGKYVVREISNLSD